MAYPLQVNAAKKAAAKSGQNRYVVPTAEGMKVSKVAPLGSEKFFEVHPDGTVVNRDLYAEARAREANMQNLDQDAAKAGRRRMLEDKIARGEDVGRLADEFPDLQQKASNEQAQDSEPGQPGRTGVSAGNAGRAAGTVASPTAAVHGPKVEPGTLHEPYQRQTPAHGTPERQALAARLQELEAQLAKLRENPDFLAWDKAKLDLNAAESSIPTPWISEEERQKWREQAQAARETMQQHAAIGEEYQRLSQEQDNLVKDAAAIEAEDKAMPKLEAFTAKLRAVDGGPADTQLWALPGMEKQVAAVGREMEKLAGREQKHGTTPPRPSVDRYGQSREVGKGLAAPAKTQPQVLAVLGEATGEDTRYSISGVGVDHGGRRIAATDGRRLHIVQIDRVGHPVAGDGTWAADGLYQVGKGGTLTPYESENAAGFPPIDDVAKLDAPKLQIDRYSIPELYRMARQAAAIAPDSPAYGTKGKSILWHWNPATEGRGGLLGMAAANPESGYAVVGAPVGQGAIELGGMDASYLMDALDFLRSATGNDEVSIQWQAPNKPTILKASGQGVTAMAVVMPINAAGGSSAQAQQRLYANTMEIAGPDSLERAIVQQFGQPAEVAKATRVVVESFRTAFEPVMRRVYGEQADFYSQMFAGAGQGLVPGERSGSGALMQADAVRESLSRNAAEQLRRIGAGERPTHPVALGTVSPAVVEASKTLGMEIPAGTSQEVGVPELEHLHKRHPDLTPDDYAMIPAVVHSPTQIAITGGKYQRVWFLRQDEGSDRLYIAKYGGRDGRMRMLTYYRESRDVVLRDLKGKGMTLVTVANPAVQSTSSVNRQDANPGLLAARNTPLPENSMPKGQGTVKDNPDVLSQQDAGGNAKAAVEFMKDGRALLHALKDPDASSALHELWHVFHNQVIRLAEATKDPQLLQQVKVLEAYAGVKGGKWTEAAMEKIARAGERYIEKAIHPIKMVRDAMEQFKAWLGATYAQIRGTGEAAPIDVELSPELEAVFEQWLTPAEQWWKPAMEETRGAGDAETRSVEQPRAPSGTGDASPALRDENGDTFVAPQMGKEGTARIPDEYPPLEREVKPLAMPELVTLARELFGSPSVFKHRKGRSWLGQFRSVAGLPESGKIVIDQAAAETPEQLARTMAHEIGHGLDFIPENTLKRRTIRNRIASLLKAVESALKNVPKEKVLRKELEALSSWWKGQIPDSGKYAKYRKQGKELYADAVSVLLNSPGDLQKRAPNFYGAFMKHLDAKPHFKAAWLAMQELAGATNAEARHEARRAAILGGFEAAETKWRGGDGRSDDLGAGEAWGAGGSGRGDDAVCFDQCRADEPLRQPEGQAPPRHDRTAQHHRRDGVAGESQLSSDP